LIKKEGFDFEFDPLGCNSCEGNCCRGESGYIWTKYAEIEKMAKLLEMSLEDFAKIYLRKVGHRYSLIEKELGDGDFACIFFDEVSKGCKIYEARPLQCRTYPFWDSFKDKDYQKELRAECPAVVWKD